MASPEGQDKRSKSPDRIETLDDVEPDELVDVAPVEKGSEEDTDKKKASPKEETSNAEKDPMAKSKLLDMSLDELVKENKKNKKGGGKGGRRTRKDDDKDRDRVRRRGGKGGGRWRDSWGGGWRDYDDSWGGKGARRWDDYDGWGKGKGRGYDDRDSEPRGGRPPYGGHERDYRSSPYGKDERRERRAERSTSPPPTRYKDRTASPAKEKTDPVPVKISNVPKELTVGDIERAFESSGQVLKSEGEKGTFILTYAEKQGAEDAISRYDGGTLNNKKIRVTFLHGGGDQRTPRGKVLDEPPREEIRRRERDDRREREVRRRAPSPGPVYRRRRSPDRGGRRRR